MAEGPSLVTKRSATGWPKMGSAARHRTTRQNIDCRMDMNFSFRTHHAGGKSRRSAWFRKYHTALDASPVPMEKRRDCLSLSTEKNGQRWGCHLSMLNWSNSDFFT